jgi:hypothetical protein
MSLDFVLNPLTGLFDVTGSGGAVAGGAMGAVNHGADADVARPDYDVVHWVGSVEPDNALDGDLWTDTDAPAGGWPLYTFADTFTRADSSTSLGVMEEPAGYGYAWEITTGSPTGWGINGNAAYHPGGDYGIATIAAAAAAATSMTVSAGADEEFWLMFRVIDGSNYYRFGHTGADPTYIVQKIKAAGLGTIATSLSFATADAADGDVVMVATRENDGFDCWVNGTRLFGCGDPEWYTSYRVGFGAYGNTDLRISEFSTIPLGGGVSPIL